MTEWIGLILDSVLIVVVGIGVVQAIRLIRQLQDLRASRAEMERFVRDFNSAVSRAEAGIKTLRSTARESGDDLEKLVEKAGMVRDELTFIVESADGLAERLSVAASKVMHSDQEPPKSAFSNAPTRQAPVSANAKADSGGKSAEVSEISRSKASARQASRAEQELIQALKKLG
jgi:hypothetical protein